MFGPFRVFRLDINDHSGRYVRHALQSRHVHELNPPGPNAEIRRLCVTSDMGCFGP